MIKERPVATLRRRLLHRSVPYSLFAVGCALSIAASSYLSWSSAVTGELQAHAEFLTDARQAGLEADLLLSTWDVRPWREDSDFLVAVLRPT